MLKSPFWMLLIDSLRHERYIKREKRCIVMQNLGEIMKETPYSNVAVSINNFRSDLLLPHILNFSSVHALLKISILMVFMSSSLHQPSVHSSPY